MKFLKEIEQYFEKYILHKYIFDIDYDPTREVWIGSLVKRIKSGLLTAPIELPSSKTINSDPDFFENKFKDFLKTTLNEFLESEFDKKKWGPPLLGWHA